MTFKPLRLFIVEPASIKVDRNKLQKSTKTQEKIPGFALGIQSFCLEIDMDSMSLNILQLYQIHRPIEPLLGPYFGHTLAIFGHILPLSSYFGYI